MTTPTVGNTLERVASESGLTHAQIQIWIGQRLDPECPLYNMAFSFLLEGRVDFERFRKAWTRVVEASDALRSSVVERDGIPVLEQLDPKDIQVDLLDFADAPKPLEAFRAWAEDETARAIPLAGSLVRCVVAQIDEARSAWYLCQHHLITDAASTALLFDRVAAEYAALASESEPTEPAPLAPYYETAAELRRAIPTDARSQASQHWSEKLDGETRAVPFYGRGLQVMSTASRRIEIRVDEQRSRRLRELAEEDGWESFTPDISRFAVFATLLASWIHRASGEAHVGFDAPSQNRASPEAKQAPGLFVEMFPIAVDVPEGATFRDLGRSCLGEIQDLLRYAIPGTSSPTGSTVSNAVLNFFPGSFGSFAGLPSLVEWVHSGHGDAVHAVRLQVHDFGNSGNYTLHLDANEGVFPQEVAERAAAHLDTLVSALLEDPDRAIAEVDLLSGDEHQRLIVDFNQTGDNPPPSETVVQRFEERAAQTPDRIALVERGRELSFDDLEHRSRAVAGELIRRGLEPEDRVAITNRRSIEMVVSILGTLRAQGSYVPIDPAYPEARKNQILDDSGARFLLSSADLAPGAETLHGGVEILTIDPPESDSRASKDDGPTPPPPKLPAPELESLAYILYTSGSTGTPKGVAIEHGGLASYLEWAERQYVRGDRLTFPLFTSVSFDLTVTSLFLPLITGGTLRIYPEPNSLVDSAFIDVINDNAVDFIKLTPSHLALLRQLDLSESRIRRVVVGGEDFRTDLAQALHEQLSVGSGAPEIYNEYGPTEAVVGCAIHRYDPELDDGASVPIGRPADHVELYVLNEALVPVPEGVSGELCIARVGLARGYHGRPALTDERFVPHPVRKGERLYRSGDLARFLPGGKLDYLGRIDRQLKISGFRVEPAEVEAVLASHPEVRSTAVMGRTRRGTRAGGESIHCLRCGIPSNVPRVVFDEEGVCGICRSHDEIREEAAGYFKPHAALEAIFRNAAEGNRGGYDCISLLSGGKDSTYVLCRLVDMGLKPLAFTLDNGYISEEAKANIRRVCKTLGVDYEFGTTPAMNEIFKDSLTRFSNVCNGCFKTIYTLSAQRAKELGIPVIVTGLSQGQFFETRLTQDLFRGGRFHAEDVDRAVLEARKAYHRADDAVSRLLDVSMFENDKIFEEIQFVDFYRYDDTSLADLLAYLDERVPWIRPSDTGRSTNCLINDVGIYIHKKERGFHNYALPYSWDVRLGHKVRDEAMDELDDEIDTDRVRTILDEIGYDENRLAGGTDDARAAYLAAYYTADAPLADVDLSRYLTERLPEHLVPHHFLHLEEIPLTPNGKVDFTALPSPEGAEETWKRYVAPDGPAEEAIAAIWTDILYGEGAAERVGATDPFFRLGGTSLAAMEVVLKTCHHFQIDLPLQTLFQHPTVRELAERVEEKLIEEISQLSDAEAERLAADSG